ncbi:hypothetical protein AQ616_18895 [Oceanobacillus sp. E9]|uniref:hypothetical protein n=1 Tax=Oceanobacillus sp. E9 TaxID=1742575 RepID=UPI00084EC3EB|nr:hypothetical protein [Oceanobacillus sp. E9]OEH52973.1 hypothetical protein AQ616_18895 [Oceanobacillus sp. E9]
MKLNRIDSPLSRTERNQVNENWDRIENDFNNVVSVISDEAFDKVVDSAKLNWLDFVDTYEDIATTYPNPSVGDAVMARKDSDDYPINSNDKRMAGTVWRFDGSDWEPIQNIDPTAINRIDEELKQEIKDIEIGTRNYINNSEVYEFGQATDDYDYWKAYEGLEKNTEYTLSFDAEFLQGGSSEITVLAHSSDGYMVPIQMVYNSNRMDATFKTDDNYIYDLLIYNGKRGETSGNQLNLTKIKLEKGNKPSDYTVSPEDIQEQFTKVNKRVDDNVTNINSLFTQIEEKEELIEHGENANGEYFRYKSGLQICLGRYAFTSDCDLTVGNFGMYRTETEKWTFPANFSQGSNTMVSGIVTSFARWFNSTLIPSRTDVSVVQFSTTEGTSYGASITAIGRWKDDI